jgi:alpha-beta hydrolase superfamily lysophospholipase
MFKSNAVAHMYVRGIFVIPLQVDDLLAFSKDVKLQYSSRLPIFVGGQSMGSLVALHAVLRDQSHWDGIILGTATIHVEMSLLLR